MTTIDNRVVQMEFDNAQFERNVQQSIYSLQNLDRSLDLKNGARSLNEVQMAADRLDFSNASTSIVSTLSTGFEAAKEHALNVFHAIGDAASMMGKVTGASILGIGATLTGLAATGGVRRALNIEQARFQLKGLGVDWSEIEDDINYAVQGTAYGLDSAAKAASQLLASNVAIGDEMKAALRGISGVAAMTNSDYDSIAQIFTAVAGQGKVMTIQLRQLELRGLNASAKLAESLGTTEAAVREMVSKGEIDFQTFSKAMDDAFGEHAKDANQTFTGAMSNVKAALSRIGADFAGPGLENIRRIFVSLIGVINDVRTALAPIVSITDRLFTSFTDWVTSVFESIDQSDIIANIGKPFKELNDSITEAKKNLSGEDLEEFLAKNDIYQGYASGLNHILTSLSLTAKTVADAFTSVFPPIEITTDVVKNLGDTFNSFILDIMPTKEELDRLGEVATAFFSLVSKGITILTGLGKGIANAFSPIINGIGNGLLSFISSVGDAIIFLDNATGSLSYVSDALRGVGLNDIADFVDSLDDVELTAENVASALELAGTKIGEFFSYIGDNLPTLETFKTFLDGAADRISDFFDTSANVFSSGGGVIDSVASTVSGSLGGIAESVKELFDNVVESGWLQAIWDRIVNFFSNVTIGDIFSGLNAVLTAGLIKSLTDIGKQFTNLDIMNILGLKQPLDMLRDTLTVWQSTINVHAILSIAAAIGILAISLGVLSTIDAAGLAQAVGAIGVMTMLLTKVVALFADIVKDPEVLVQINRLSGFLIALSVSIGILGLAAKGLSSMKPEELLKGGAALAALAAIITGVSIALSKWSGKMATSAVGLIAIAGAMVVLGAAMHIFAALPIDNMQQMATGLLLALVTMASMLALIGNLSGRILSGAVAIIAVSSAFVIMGAALHVFASLPLEKLGSTLAYLGTALIAMLAALYLAEGGLGGAAGLLMVAAAIDLLTPSLLALSAVPIDHIAAMLLALGGSLLIIGVAAVAIPAPQLFALAASLLTLSVSVAAFGAGIALAGAGILAFASALALISVIGPTAAANVATTLQVLLTGTAEAIGAAIVSIINSLGMIAESIGNQVTSLVQIFTALGMAIITALSTLLPAIADLGMQLILQFLFGISSQAAAIAYTGLEIVSNFIIGVAMGIGDLIEAGIVLGIMFIKGVSDGIRENADLVSAACESLMNTIGSVITGGLADLLDSVGIFPQEWSDSLRASSDDLASAAEEASSSIDSAVQERFGDMLDNSEESMSDLTSVVEGAGPELEAAGNSAGASFTDSLLASFKNADVSGSVDSMLGEVSNIDGTQYGEPVGEGVGEGIDSGLDSKGDAVTGTARGIASDVSDIDGYGSGWPVGSGLGSGIYNGLDSWAGSISDLARRIAADAINAAKKEAAEASPSKKMYKIGAYMSEGMLLGISSLGDKIADTAAEVTRGGIKEAESLGLAMSEVFDNLDPDMQPVIRPVLDMTDVNNGFNSINGLMPSGNISAAGWISARRQNAEASSSRVVNNNMTITLDYTAGVDANQVVMDIANVLKRRSILEG